MSSEPPKERWISRGSGIAYYELSGRDVNRYVHESALDGMVSKAELLEWLAAESADYAKMNDLISKVAIDHVIKHVEAMGEEASR
jgi:hypothetical protein